ncbi:MAG TPA: 3-isopropylmalate dehydratase small subunit [Rectinemataceae bacterium]|nr:3-isopropylmalate dehydratase small subunit [Rectinemataceae bacterium]
MGSRGKTFRYGDNVDTDVIIPARYLNSADAAELALHCMEDLDREFTARVRPGDVIVAGSNFGCGSSREHAPMAIKASGIACVVAASFARIFYRNAINIGLPILECPEAAEGVAAGDELEIELAEGRVRNLTSGKEYRAQPYPEFMRSIMEAGGLIEYTRSRMPKSVAERGIPWMKDGQPCATI